MTRRTTAHLFSTVNGVVEAPNEWQFGAWGEAEEASLARGIDGVDDVLIGRGLYEEWKDFWPSSDIEPFASFINGTRKHVVSSTLGDDLEWQNSSRVDGDPVAYLRDLREREGGTISVPGGIDLIRSLFVAGLIDELTLTIHPAVTNHGRRLFDDSVELSRLVLLSSTATAAGNVISSYALRSED